MPPIAGLQGRRLRLGDQGSDTARWTGVPRIASTKVFLDTGDFRMLNAATVGGYTSSAWSGPLMARWSNICGRPLPTAKRRRLSNFKISTVKSWRIHETGRQDIVLG